MLKNALVASEGKFPLCQDTGIANIFGWKKGRLFLAENEYEALSEGAKKLYDERKLRFSTSCPSSFYDEYDPKNNMPAQVAMRPPIRSAFFFAQRAADLQTKRVLGKAPKQALRPPHLKPLSASISKNSARQPVRRIRLRLLRADLAPNKIF